MAANIPILSFNAGEASPLIDARSDVEKYRSLCRHLENFIPRIYGGVERRPGTYYYQTAYSDTDGVVRLIPFIYSSSVAYVLEFGDAYIRALYDGSVIDTITSPYAVADVFELQYKQLGDTMWIVHKDYKPRKLTRISATAFSIEEITFRNGPFLTRNDLIDPDVSTTATMTCSVTDVGDSGTLTCNSSVFDSDHVGALFKLIHPKTTTTVTQNGEGTSSALDIKGTFSFTTTGVWTGTVKLQRRENSTSDNDWEDFRTYVSQIQYSGTEEFSNVEYRIKAEAGMSAAFKGKLSSHEQTQTGIVEIDSVTNAITAGVTVVKELASTNATQRWAEGAWSDYRGWPSSVTFKDDRCIYGGTSVLQTLELREYEYGTISEFDYTGYTDNLLYIFGDYSSPSTNDVIAAQTFTPAASHSIKQVTLTMARTTGSPGADCVLAIRNCNQTTGEPDLTGTSLVEQTFDGADLTVASDPGAPEGSAETIVFDTAIALTAGTIYAIVIYAPNGTGTSYAIRICRSEASIYSGGKTWKWTYTGAAWNSGSTVKDMNFSESGYAI